MSSPPEFDSSAKATVGGVGLGAGRSFNIDAELWRATSTQGIALERQRKTKI